MFVTMFAYAQFPGQGSQSRIVTDSIRSSVLSAWRTYTIYLPKSYDVDTSRKYPILYLLHGMMGTNTDWTEKAQLKDVTDHEIANGEACEMIIVTPNAGGDIYAGEWNGYFDMPGWKYETFFYTEFLPYIEKHYRVIGDKQHRAVAGLSMGGGGTTSYAERHSDMYGAAYAMSALMSIPQTNGSNNGSPHKAGDKMLLLTNSVQEYDCIQYILKADEKTKEQLRSIAWFVDCGDDDFLLQRNIEFFQAMQKQNIPLQFRVRDGVHDWEYWHSALYTCLPFVTRVFFNIK